MNGPSGGGVAEPSQTPRSTRAASLKPTAPGVDGRGLPDTRLPRDDREAARPGDNLRKVAVERSKQPIALQQPHPTTLA